jgi:hypothetical protein
MAPITTLCAALVGVLYIALAGLVVRGRQRHKIDLGPGAKGEIEQSIRAHANLAENAPIFLILLLLAELGGAPVWLLYGAGAVFIVARVLHGAGLSGARGYSFGRFYGTLFTWLLILGLSVYLLVRTLAAA